MIATYGPTMRSLLVLLCTTLAGCNGGGGRTMRPPENTYANLSEAAVRSALGAPRLEFEGHYGNPPISFTDTFSGNIKTLVFKKPGGQYYVSFEERPSGWVSIRSSWLRDGAVF